MFGVSNATFRPYLRLLCANQSPRSAVTRCIAAAVVGVEGYVVQAGTAHWRLLVDPSRGKTVVVPLKDSWFALMWPLKKCGSVGAEMVSPALIEISGDALVQQEYPNVRASLRSFMRTMKG